MAAEHHDYAHVLRAAGLRATPQRLAVMAVLMHATDHPNAEELCQRAKQVNDTVSLATIYRTLTSLEEAGLIRKLLVEGEPARFEIAPDTEHDDMIDVETGEVVEIPSVEINALRRDMARRLGYDIVSQHTIIRVKKRPKAAD